jgi:PAS domain S-box-containing protein
MKIERQILYYGILSIAIIAGFLYFSNYNRVHSLETQSLVNHTNEVIRELDNVQAMTTNIESNTRGFVISDSIQFIKDLSSKKASIEGSLVNLKRLNAVNVNQYNDILVLEDFVISKIEFNNRIVRSHLGQSFQKSAALIRSLKGKYLMDSIFVQIQSIREEEMRLLNKNLAHNKEALQKNFNTQIYSAIFYLLLIFIFLFILNKGIFKRKAAEHEVVESERKLRVVLNSTQDAIFLIDRDSTLRVINEPARNIVDNTPGMRMKIGEKLFDHTSGSKKRIYQKIFESVFQGNHEHQEVNINFPQGSRWFETVFSPVKDEIGNVTGICISSRDITERIQYQEELVDARKKAETAEQLQETFLANMSHEIRTPMNGIVGMTDILGNMSLSQEQKSIVKTIKKSSDTLLFLINDILDLSKIKAGKLSIEKVEFELNELLDSVFTPFEIKSRFKGIEFDVVHRPSMPLNLVGDEFRLIQVLNNLLGNAIKFTKEGKVEVSIREVKRNEEMISLEFRIRDTGIGIEKDKLQSIFNSFEQGTENISRKFGGTGLGLSITKKLVELQGGTIRVDSLYGIGSIFSFQIDYKLACQEKEIQPSKNISRTNLSGLKNKSILVAEDNEINQLVITHTLKNVGVHVTIAENGHDAIAHLQQSDYDLVIMDLQMPGMDGIQTTRVIREHLKNEVPIIAMTASVMRNERANCLAAGMNDYLSKPFDQSELFSSLTRLICGTGQEFIVAEISKEKQHTSYDLSIIKEMEDDSYTSDILKQFLDTTPVIIQQLEDALTAKNYQQVFFMAHKLKSGLGLLKVNGMLADCSEIESITRESKEWNEQEHDQIVGFLQNMRKQYLSLQPALEKELKQVAAVY